MIWKILEYIGIYILGASVTTYAVSVRHREALSYTGDEKYKSENKYSKQWWVGLNAIFWPFAWVCYLIVGVVFVVFFVPCFILYFLLTNIHNLAVHGQLTPKVQAILSRIGQ